MWFSDLTFHTSLTYSILKSQSDYFKSFRTLVNNLNKYESNQFMQLDCQIHDSTI